MNIDKAIEILTLMGTPDFDGHTEDILAARNLGIEALTLLTKQRRYGLTFKGEMLPSETPPKPLHALGFNTGDDESP